MSAIPRYRHIKDAILDRIGQGKLVPGDRISSENEIVAEFGVSRMTANRVLRELMFAGVLTRVPGVGTFVAAPRIQTDLLHIRNIADEVHDRRQAYSARIVTVAAIEATGTVTQALNLPSGSAVLHSVIVHHENGQPIQLEDRYVNPAVAPDYLSVDFQAITPNAYLTGVAPITGFEHIVEAILPDARTCELLGVGKGEPCLRLFRRTWSAGIAVSCAWLTHPGHRYRLEARSGQPEGS